MKFGSTLSAIALAATTMASAPVSAADYSLVFQGVTFEFSVVDSDTFTLTMLDTDSATGNWTGVTDLNAFQVKQVGKGFTDAFVTGPGGFLNEDHELNAGGCSGSGNGPLRLCFSGLAAVAPSLSWTVDLVGSTLAIGPDGPKLKVRFGTDDDDKTGSLLSKNLPAVPEPETYALMLAGLAAVGYLARRRKTA